MKKSVNNNKSTILMSLAFAIPVGIMLIVAIVCRMAPFGDNVLLISDINNQFVAFFAYFKDVITSSNDFAYTFSKCLGGDMVGFSAYYLNNPFLLLLLPCPNAKLPILLFYIMILQIGLMGLTFYLFVRDIGGESAANLIFSTSYALMGYVAAYITLPMYFNNLILLPLVMMGLHRLIRQKRHFVLYVISLALSIWTNYYLGYMVCIFIGLYVVMLCISGKISKFNDFMRIVVMSVLGVCLAGFCLIPTVVSIAGTKSAPKGDALKAYLLFGPTSLIRNLLPGTFYGNLSNLCAPYIYVGVITLFGMVLYIFATSITLREKISHLMLLAILIASAAVNTLDIVWHAFNAPVGFAHRFAFIISFYMIYMCYIGYKSAVSNNDRLGIVTRPVVGYAVLTLVCVELLFNMYRTLDVYLATSETQQSYEEYLDKVTPVIDKIQAEDSGIYRIEKDFERNHNDAMQFAYTGLSHNSSCEKDYVKTFIGRMGLRNQGIWAFYNQGSTSFTDMFLGVKYYVSRFDSTNKPGVFDFAGDECYVYRNEYALPLGFMTTDKIADVDMTQENPFERQNDIIRAFGHDFSAYESASYDVALTNLTEEEVEVVPTDDIGTNTVLPNKATQYTLIDNTSRGVLTYNVYASKPCNLYCYFTAPCQQKVQLYKNEEDLGDYFSDFRWGIVNLGNYEAGDSVSVNLELANDNVTICNAFFYEEDPGELLKWAKGCQESTVQVLCPVSSRLEIDANVAQDGLMVFSIPYEKDWSIKVDGKKVPQTEVLECLMAIDMTNGEHHISMKYVPRGLYLGVAISIISLLVVICLLVVLGEGREDESCNNTRTKS